jgi:hypothetical protein
VIAKVVLAEFSRVVAQVQQEFGERRRARQQVTGGAGQLGHDHARPQRMHAGEESRATSGAALLGIISHESRAFIREAINVRGLTDHKPLVISGDVHDADVVAHDEQDVGFFVGGDCRVGQRQSHRDDR